MAPSYVFAVSILCLYVRFCVCFHQSDRISDLRLCVDTECKGVISYARTLLRYSGDHPKILSFERNKEVKVFSKSAGTKPDLWGGEINGRRGYFPRTFVQEYKVFVQNPLEIVPTEREPFPVTVEEQKSNNTHGVGDKPLTVENVIPNGEPHHEITSGNKTTANSEIEDKKRAEKSPLTRRLLSLDDQESMSVQETTEQIPPPPVPLIDSPIQIGTDDAVKAEDRDDDPITNPSETKSFILVEGTKVEVGIDQDETPHLVTVQPTRTPVTPVGVDSVAAGHAKLVPAPTVVATPPTPSTATTTTAETAGEDAVTSRNKGEISPTSSSSAADTGEVQYAADLAKPEGEEDSSPKTADAWFEGTATASTDEEMKGIEKQEEVGERSEVAVKADKKEAEGKKVEVASESKGIFSGFFNREMDDKANASDADIVGGNAVNVNEPAQKVELEDSDVDGEKDDVEEGEDDAVVDEQEGDDDDYDGIGDENDDDESDQTVDETDTQNLTEAATAETVGVETVAMEAVATEAVATETVGTVTVAKETVGMETVAKETAAMETVAKETVGIETVGIETVGMETVAKETVGMVTVAKETVGMVTVAMETVGMETVGMVTVAKETVGMETVAKETVGMVTVAKETVAGPTLNSIEADEHETDVMVDAVFESQMNSNDHDRSDVEVDEIIKWADAVLPDTIKRDEHGDVEVDTVTPFGVDDPGDDGHCVDCGSYATTEVPVDVRVEGKSPGDDDDGGGSESWNERWNRLDVKETAKPYVEVIGTYTQMIIDVLPEPLYVMLLDLQERAVSPRVVVFTFIVGIFTFFIGFTYLALYYKIKGSGTFLAAKLSSLDQKLFTAIAERNCLHETLGASERKIESLIEDWRSANDDAETFRRDLKVSRRECEELRANAANLEEQLETAVQTGLEVNRMLYEFLTSQSDNLRLQKALENLESELHRQKTAVSEMSADAVDTVQANLRLKLELEESQAEVASLQEQNTNLLADAMSSETTRDTLELQLSNQNEELEQLRSGNEQLLKEAADWDATVKALERRIATLAQENVEMKGALTSKKTELQALEEIVSQMKPDEEDNGDMLAKVLDVARLKSELKSVAAERDTLQSKLKFEAAAKEQLEEQMFAGAADVDKMRKEWSAALNAKEDAEKRLQVLSSYFKEKEMELQMELGLQQAKRQQTQETAVTSTQKAALYEQEVSLYKSQIDGLKKEIEDQERSFKMQVAEHEKKAHNNWLAARNAERRLEEMKRESSMLRNKLTSMDQEKESLTRSNPDGTTLQTNSSRFYGVNGESIPSNSPGLPADLPPPPPPSSGPSSLYHEPIDFRRMPHQPFLPPDRPLPPPHFLLNHMPPPAMHPFADRGPGGPMPMFPGPPPHLYDRGMPSPPPDYRFGPPPPPPLYPIPRRRSPPAQSESSRRSTSPFDTRVAGPGSRTPGPESSMPLPSRQWLPSIDARREPAVPSSRHDLIRDPRTSSPLTSELNKPSHGRNSAV